MYQIILLSWSQNCYKKRDSLETCFMTREWPDTSGHSHKTVLFVGCSHRPLHFVRQAASKLRVLFPWFRTKTLTATALAGTVPCRLYCMRNGAVMSLSTS